MTADSVGDDYTNFVRLHSPFVMLYLKRRVPDVDERNDVSNETFAIVWEKWDERPEEKKEQAWLTGIARGLLSNHRRSRTRRERLVVRLAFERAEEENDDESLTSARILLAVANLKEKDQELLRLVYWDGWSYLQISIFLEISENAVAIRVNRARGRLESELGKSGVTEIYPDDEEEVD